MTLRVLLPVGISFYTFVTMSYVIDVYRREIPATREPVGLRACSSRTSRTWWPGRSCGRRSCCRRSTTRASITPRADARRRLARSPGGSSRRCSSPTISSAVANAVFEPGTHHTGINVLLGIYAFAFQIYGDFAGYSNIARGISKLMGIELLENFRFPYFVRTPQEFWRHWHISLSTWLRDYLYIPLGGNRGAAWQTDRNLLITMVLGGLWHGAAWTFVLWGVFHGLLLIGYRSAERLAVVAAVAARHRHRLRAALGWAVMFHLTCFGWLIFRARSAGAARAI